MLLVVAVVGERVKFVVVSADVVVPTAGGGVSPGALIVDETAVEEPSWTTSYCVCSRFIESLPRWQAAATIRSVIGISGFEDIADSQSRTLYAMTGGKGALSDRPSL
jgi:hypothetical protein